MLITLIKLSEAFRNAWEDNIPLPNPMSTDPVGNDLQFECRRLRLAARYMSLGQSAAYSNDFSGALSRIITNGKDLKASDLLFAHTTTADARLKRMTRAGAKPEDIIIVSNILGRCATLTAALQKGTISDKTICSAKAPELAVK